jgi:hypothetical protein
LNKQSKSNWIYNQVTIFWQIKTQGIPEKVNQSHHYTIIACPIKSGTTHRLHVIYFGCKANLQLNILGKDPRYTTKSYIGKVVTKWHQNLTLFFIKMHNNINFFLEQLLTLSSQIKEQTLIYTNKTWVIGYEVPDDHHGKTMSKQYKLQHSHQGCTWCKRKLPVFSCNLCYRCTPCLHHPLKLNQLPTIWIKKEIFEVGTFSSHNILSKIEQNITAI